MENNRYQRLRDIFLVSVGAALLVYIIVRILNVSLSCDENGSYFMFASKGAIFPQTYDLFSANNHSLNTAMMIACERIFGTNQFAIRFPNLIGAVLYIFSTAMMCRRMRSPVIGMLTFLVLNTNPYMIQYFCVARGYGIAAGFMSLAFWQLWLYFDEHYRFRHLAVAVVAGTLAIFANYSYLHLFLPVAGFAGLIALWQPGKQNVGKAARILPAAFIAFFVLGSLAVIVPIGQQIKDAGGFWPTGITTFWSGAVASVVQCMLYDVTHDETIVQRIVIVIGALYVVASLAVVVWSIVRWKEGVRKLFPFFVFAVLTLSGLSVMMQFWLMDTEIVVQRMCLFMVWPLMLLIGLAADLPGRVYWAVAGPFAVLTFVLTWHFFRTASIDKEAYHPPSENVQDAIALIEAQSGHAPVSLGLDPTIYAHGFEFYLLSGQHPQFNIVLADSLLTHPLNEYCFLTAPLRGKATAPQWELLAAYTNGNAVFRNTQFQKKNVLQLPANTATDTLITLTEENVAFNSGYHVADTLSDSAHVLVRVKFQMKRPRFTWGGHWISWYRNGKEQYVYRTDLRMFPASDDWQDVEFTAVLPQLQAGDDIITATYWEHGESIELKNYSVTLEVF